MKFTAPKKSFQSSLAAVLPAVASKATLHVLSHVLLQASPDGRLSLSATNLEIGIVTELEVSVEVPGAVCVRASALADIVATLPDADVALTLSASQLDIACAGASWALHTLPADEFPPMDFPADLPTATLPAALLAQIARQVAPFASREEARPVLQSVHLLASDGQLKAEASDGFRLALACLPLEAGFEALAPAGEFKRMAALAQGEDVQIGFRNGYGYVTGRTTRMCLRLIEGRFPDVSKIIPAELPIQATLDAHSLSTALRRIEIVSSSGSGSAHLLLSPGKITVSGTSDDIGAGSDEVPAEIDGLPEGQPFEIAFNAAYLRQAVDVCGERATLRLCNPHSPAIVTPVETQGYRHLIMPMMLG